MLLDVPDDALILTEETFGRVAVIVPFDTEEEVVKRANKIEYGLVAVNRTKVTGAPIPFGRTKKSGLGSEGARRGMGKFMEIKYVCRDWAQENN